MDLNKPDKQNTPLLVCNVWDVMSAKIAQELDFQIIGTSSGAIASMLGYSDGEEISIQELEYIIHRIINTVHLPLTVDLEAGYSRDPVEIAENILRLSKLGVVGINIEDSIVNGERVLLNANTFGDTLKEVCSILARRKQRIFINVRTDTFLLNVPDPVNETIRRATKYYKAGANGLFVPCIERDEDIRVVAKAIKLPLNVMCMPNLPGFKVLQELGVKRISMGNFAFTKGSQLLKNELQQILINRSFKSLFQ